VRTRFHRRLSLRLGALLCCAIMHNVYAQEATERGQLNVAPSHSQEYEVDSEHIFGFVEGSDVGDKGEREAEIQTDGGFGKRRGDYAATSTAVQLKYSVTDNLRFAPTIDIAYHNITGVPDIDDVHALAFQGFNFEIKYRVLNRTRAPVGLTFVANPYWNRIDRATGERVEQYSLDLRALLDREIIKERLYAAFNIIYVPEWTKPDATGSWEPISTLGLGGAVTSQIIPRLFFGGEMRYMRAYDGAVFNTFAGQALFIGPTLFVALSKHANVTLAWNAQVAGHAADASGALDLVNFERHQVRVRVGIGF
jgi:hypothetical protein